MSFQTVPASQGLKWLTDALTLILKNPVPYLLMGLVVGVAGAVPLLGSLALAVLGPALYAGIMYAAREHEAGGVPDFKHLFQAFNEPGKLPKMLILCLPGIAAGVVLAILGVIFLGGALIGAGVSSATNSSVVGAGVGVGFLLFILIALAIGVFVYALTFFAIPRVMFDNAEPIPAMQDSLKACLANVGAILLFVVVLIGAALVVSLVIGFISSILAQVVLMTLMAPVVSVAMYRAWRDVYRGSVTQEFPPVEPPMPPSPPPSVEA